MSAQETPTARRQRRFPGLRIRPAQSYDFPRMARMANEIFQHERDIDHFNKHRSIKMGYEPEARAADRLLAAETDWRLADMRRNRRNPGRHFIVATYLKQPAGYLTRRHGAHPREELLGWAEWQDPGHMAAEPALRDGFSDSDQSESSQRQWRVKAGSALEELESVLEGMTLVHGDQALLIPSNGLAVPLPEAVESFRRAGTDYEEEWKRWYKQFLPSCLGQNGDVHGRHLGMTHGSLFH
ncbi:hypothetical protein C8A01DRAFT_12178 [Parachaetomium inaequale]|uniref:Uncharacterized protein n=1 Tax=Parachaetomium inaequale TaxID=2588326 RepID=A0AAN6PR04_9PEZI|nr:hypothetical protein C8A01DRAFT_12178 [Parachaetomium inaequale]